jgi:hypothetical protein
MGDVAMSMIRPSDPDFRICLVDFNTLIKIQSDAERLGVCYSMDLGRCASRAGKRKGRSSPDTYAGEASRGYPLVSVPAPFLGRGWCNFRGLATIDLDLERLESLDRLDRDPDVRKALVRIFSLALGGISGVEKK